MFGSGVTTLIISNEKIVDIVKIVKSLKVCDLLKKELAKQFKMKQKYNMGNFSECYYSS